MIRKRWQVIAVDIARIDSQRFIPNHSKYRDVVLDKGRPHPMLKISRRQLPLTPAFAMASHAAQGQTCTKGAIVNLKIGGSSSAMISCVAITRAERRRDLLVFRPFPRELFDQDRKPGLELLLKVWRREHIDWEDIEKQLTPQQRCYRCGISKYKKQLLASAVGQTTQTWQLQNLRRTP